MNITFEIEVSVRSTCGAEKKKKIDKLSPRKE